MPGYVLKKKEGGGGKREVVCRLVRLQEKSSKSNSLQKESTGAKVVGGVSPRVKRELERGGKVMTRKEGGPEMKKGEGGSKGDMKVKVIIWPDSADSYRMHTRLVLSRF